MNITKVEIYFSQLFSKVILKNSIVATILYTVLKKIIVFKTKMENTLNNDI